MAMALGGGGGAQANINVTPLIDVLLVLLIIFMVITPLTPHGLEALVPQPPKEQKQEPTPERTIVVQVINHPGQTPELKINQDDVAWNQLQDQLRDIYKTRAEKVMFVKGDDDLTFDSVAKVIDIAHGADPDIKIGLMTAAVEAGQ